MISQVSSSNSPSPTPQWKPPRAPLPPHRLAKLANALGVSTPIPAASISRSFSDSISPVDPYRRSPTPSSAPISTSKFLLHVLPPLSFPCTLPGDQLVPPPSTASGYHTQFRRGILVPVYSSFQTLLSAIAKEYALPSTTGLILYLINTSTSPCHSNSLPMAVEPVQLQEEPGPRLSDDIWRHIWTRVVQVEQGDDITPPTSGLVRLKTGSASRSTPHLLGITPLRSLSSTSVPDVPPLNATSPSTPSTTSDDRSQSKSVACSSPDDPETPDTSAPPNDFDLPGLRSPSLIPILAKVEFDIDRRKANWYGPWLRNRKANYAKRAASKKGSATDQEGEERHPPVRLIIGRHSGYQQLSEGYNDDDDSGEAEFVDDAATPNVAVISGNDPLVDVFGTDADAWADIHAANIGRRPSNSDVVNLALTAADLNNLPDESLQDPTLHVQPEEEVRELIERMSRPGSSSTAKGVPVSPSSSTSGQASKKHIPPPLVLPSMGQSSPLASSPGSVNLAYLNGGSSPAGYVNGEAYDDDDDGDDDDDQYGPVRSSTESEKRAGIIYDDFDLGLDQTEDFDENDPNDRRRSQFLLKAQLDKIERAMAQLSPRMLNPDLEIDSFASASFSPKKPNSILRSPNLGMLNADYYPPSPSIRGPSDLGRGSSPNLSSQVQGPPRSSSANATINPSQPAWPAAPFSSIQDSHSQVAGNSSRIDDPPSPPRLALNGVTTSVPRSSVPVPTSGVSAETERRKRESEEEYPAMAKPPSPAPARTADSPVIPLSPDPFGRYSSSQTDSSVETRLSNSSIHEWDTTTVGRGSVALESVAEDETADALASQARSRSATVSRFSADSVTIGEQSLGPVKPSTKSGLMNVKSIRRLWRKSNSSKSTTDMNGSLVPISGRNSPLAPPVRPERPSQETMDLPDVEHPFPDPPPNFKAYSPQPSPSHPLPPGRVSQDQQRPVQDQQSPSRTSHDQMGAPNAHVPNVPQSKQGFHISNTPKQGGFPTTPPLPNHTPAGLMVPPQTHSGGLGVPQFVGRNGNSSPIIAAQMLPRGGSAKNKLHFDQESPYPVLLPSSPRYSPRTVSPPPLPPSPALPMPSTPPTAQQIQSLPAPAPEKEKLTGRKSILKTFQKSKSSPVPPPPTVTEPRSSIDKPSLVSRPRRPSFHSTKTSSTSVNDIPPSPHLPEQYLGGTGSKNGTTLPPASSAGDSTRQPRLTTPLTDSANLHSQHPGRSGSPPPLSMVSSRSSQETRPSVDISQFEIVSPQGS